MNNGRKFIFLPPDLFLYPLKTVDICLNLFFLWYIAYCSEFDVKHKNIKFLGLNVFFWWIICKKTSFYPLIPNKRRYPGRLAGPHIPKFAFLWSPSHMTFTGKKSRLVPFMEINGHLLETVDKRARPKSPKFSHFSKNRKKSHFRLFLDLRVNSFGFLVIFPWG